jgi:hypothetical protein
MADPILLKLARNKVIFTAFWIGVGYWLLWPGEPIPAWLEHQSDWKTKFAFIGWAAVSLGLIYDSATGLYKAFMATPPAGTRRR